ncbi:XRE family transcriptional regulator [Streptomyces sp. NBC_00091]|uniref:XRE family transcriptional regulator n=1 Tax=Streptomyces sp. NBC_00091 TaxID=2975648 RepID=UPI002B1E066E|nr:XRE family transcriptional regulator [Streptomyces sp. NBC_00091]
MTSRVKVGQDKELVHSYPYRSACPSTTWAKLVAETTTDMLLSGYTNYFFWTMIPDFTGIIRKKAGNGCRVRFLLGDPNGETTRQREAIEDAALTVSTRIRMTLEQLDRIGPLDGLEVRVSAPEDATNHVGLSVFLFDSDALVTPHLARVIGHDSPMFHLRRQNKEGMFDRFSGHAEELWERGTPYAFDQPKTAAGR